MKTFYPILTTCILCISLSNCTHNYYIPNAMSTPVFEEPGDLYFSGSIFSFGHQFTGNDLQFACAVTPRIAVMSNFFWARGGDRDRNNFNEGYVNNRLSEYGLGYYRPLNENLRLSIFGGWGHGRINNYYAEGGSSNLKFHRYFFQPQFTYKEKWVEATLSYRLGRLDFQSAAYSISTPQIEVEAIDDIANNPTFFLHEFAITAKVGIDPGGYFYIQLLRSNNYGETFLEQERMNYNVGFVVTFNPKDLKKTNKEGLFKSFNP